MRWRRKTGSESGRRLSDLAGDCSGVTLVEMSVTLALTVLFAFAAGSILIQGLRLQEKLRSAADAVLVSEMILDKVTSEIAGAESGSRAVITRIGEEENGFPVLTLEMPGEKSVRISRTGEQGEYLLIRRSGGISEETEWMFGEEMYQGFVIRSLDFTVLESDGIWTDVIQTDLKIENAQTGFSYAGFRCGACMP